MYKFIESIFISTEATEKTRGGVLSPTNRKQNIGTILGQLLGLYWAKSWDYFGPNIGTIWGQILGLFCAKYWDYLGSNIGTILGHKWELFLGNIWDYIGPNIGTMTSDSLRFSEPFFIRQRFIFYFNSIVRYWKKANVWIVSRIRAFISSCTKYINFLFVLFSLCTKSLSYVIFYYLLARYLYQSTHQNMIYKHIYIYIHIYIHTYIHRYIQDFLFKLNR